MKPSAENVAQLASAGFDFDAWLDLVQEHQIHDVDRSTNFPLHPAHYRTHHAEAQMVEFIGRVENIAADFERLCSMVGIAGQERTNENCTRKVSEGESRPAGSRYLHLMGNASIRKINHLFKTDFEMFGYQVMPG